MKLTLVAVAVLGTLTACGSEPAATPAQTPTASASSSSPQPSAPATVDPTPAGVKQTPAGVAAAIKAAVPSVTKIVGLTEDNDVNNKIGRPNGFSAGEYLYDSALVPCTVRGVASECGAEIEQWPSQRAAQERSDYIQGVLKSMPAFGTEWNLVSSTGLLLRVSGELKPSAYEKYAAAFKAATKQ